MAPSVALAGAGGSLPCPVPPGPDGLLLVARALPQGGAAGGAAAAPRFTAAAFTDTGCSLALTTDAGHVFVLDTRPRARRRFVQLDALDGAAAALAWAARGRRVLFAAPAAGGCARAYDVATRASAALPGNRAPARSLGVRAGGEQLAVASADGVVLWDLGGGAARRRLLPGAPYGTVQVRERVRRARLRLAVRGARAPSSP